MNDRLEEVHVVYLLAGCGTYAIASHAQSSDMDWHITRECRKETFFAIHRYEMVCGEFHNNTTRRHEPISKLLEYVTFLSEFLCKFNTMPDMVIWAVYACCMHGRTGRAEPSFTPTEHNHTCASLRPAVSWIRAG
jgi:hypothetical protein